MGVRNWELGSQDSVRGVLLHYREKDEEETCVHMHSTGRPGCKHASV